MVLNHFWQPSPSLHKNPLALQASFARFGHRFSSKSMAFDGAPFRWSSPRFARGSHANSVFGSGSLRKFQLIRCKFTKTLFACKYQKYTYTHSKLQSCLSHISIMLKHVPAKRRFRHAANGLKEAPSGSSLWWIRKIYIYIYH